MRSGGRYVVSKLENQRSSYQALIVISKTQETRKNVANDISQTNNDENTKKHFFAFFSSGNSDKANQRSKRGLQVRESKEIVSGAHSDLYIQKHRKIEITRTLRSSKQTMTKTQKTTFLSFFHLKIQFKPSRVRYEVSKLEKLRSSYQALMVISIF